ncbi:hypothetical protein [Paenibacillus sp. CF384]|uniref:hypothetical protein n=1 Tax=Paenibacillus sp. CF384 TaxID=1884382 RepID=UPI00089B8121|nr:hypothetical protein [Paenibacillus sp. CF384]SDX15740.1 hypothetical protein SAMN05518855_1009189 [Paenibacillus sp. CF384]
MKGNRVATALMTFILIAAIAGQSAQAEPASTSTTEGKQVVYIDERDYEGELLQCVKLINRNINYMNEEDNAANRAILTSGYKTRVSEFTPGFRVVEAKLRNMGKNHSGEYVAYVDVDSKLEKKPMITTIMYVLKQENNKWLIDQTD